MRITILTILLIWLQFPLVNLYSQCTSGSEPECMCNTAQVLCSVTELNGFMASMTNFQHPNDGPDDFCGNNTVSDNPTWFSFIAWCEDIDMDIDLTNCTPGGNNNNLWGAQAVVFDACGPWNTIDCESDCNNPPNSPITLTLELEDLIIGQVYHFMIDGCGGNGNGSFCDYTISVSPLNCDEVIENWTNPIEGETTFCVGESETYLVDDLDGATTYHWYVDGTEISTTDNEEETITWNTEGEFMLCVDASNVCVPVTDDPVQICTTVTVAGPDAGTLTAAPNPLCPDEISTVDLTGYNDGTSPINYEDHIIITDPSGTVLDIFLVGPTTFDVTYNMCGVIKVYSLNFASPENVPLPSIGDNYTGSDCVDNCCDEICESIDFRDDMDPEFPNAPADETLECFELVPAMMDQLATDNCAADEMITGTESGSADLCNGGTITREWTQTDACGNSFTHTQNITVDPLVIPTYVAPPADVTIDCDGTIPPLMDLAYTNNANGLCLQEGLVTPTESGAHDPCGGTITYTWDYTDVCNNPLIHTQNITILPAPVAAYVGAPSDVTLDCSDPIPQAIDLVLTNGSTGTCLVDELITPVVNGAFDPCGSTIEYEWTFTDACGNNIDHTQIIEIEPQDMVAFISPPADVTLTCEETVTSPTDLAYSNGDMAPCLIEGTVPPTINGAFDPCGSTIEYTWEFTDPCGNTIDHTQTITIEPATEASFVNPGGDETFACADFENYTFADLMYTNSETGVCLIEGIITPVITDNRNNCDGEVVALYEYEDDCGRVISHTQTITVEAPLEPSFQNTPADFTVSCGNIPNNFPPLDYTNSETGSCLIEGSEDPTTSDNFTACGGSISNVWEFTDDCGRTILYEQIITIDPAPEPAFTTAPQDLTLSCEQFEDFTPEDLDYTNGESGLCEIAGSESPTDFGFISECGGTIVYTWEYTDDCGRTITEDQEVTVEPAPPAVFLNIPVDMTLDCSEDDGVSPDLDYDNDGSGICEISGDVTAIVTGFVDECGGIKVFDWTFTDDCARTITASQEIEYLPAPEPEFIDPPVDLTIDCDEDVPDPEVLEYDNDEDAPCTIEGEVDATIVITDNIYEYTWEFTNSCTGNTITHTQTLTKLVPVELDIDEFEIITCIGDEVDLSDFTLVDLNGTNIIQTYHDDSPATSSNEIDPEIILEDEEETYYILATNEFGCEQEAEVLIIANILVSAGEDVEEGFCKDDEIMDLYSFLHWSADLFGEFTQIDGPTDLDIIDADEVNVSNAEPGFYLFEYAVDGDDCPSDISEMEIELYEPVLMELISIECNPDGLTYTVVVINQDYDVDVNEGDILIEEVDMVTIGEIPLDEDLIIEAQDRDSKCEKFFTFLAPDCSCPTIARPVSLGNLSVCQGANIPELEVSVSVDETANWYDAAVGGNLLLANSLTFLSPESTPGLYTYFVDAESLSQAGCLSASRTAVSLEIIANPLVVDTTLNICDINQTGIATISQADIDDVAFNNLLNLTATYYNTVIDRENMVSPIVFPFTTQALMPNILYASITNSAGCTTDISVTIDIADLPQLTPVVTDESCLGFEDGSISLTVNGTGPTGTYYRGDSLLDLNLTALRAGSYTFIAIDSLSCTDTISTTVEPGLELSFDQFEYVCDDNGTSTDPNDDSYTLNFIVSNNGNPNAQNFDLTITPLGLSENQNYGELISIELDSDGSSQTLTVADAQLGCPISETLDPLLPCSSDCTAVINNLVYTCENNDTGFDPADDFYAVSINASSTNGSIAGTYNVLIDGIVSYSFTYDEDHSFDIPALGVPVTISISDSQFNNCTDEEMTTILEPCSDDCLIEATITSKLCFNAGTPALEDDDYFDLEVTVNGTNVSANYVETTTGVTNVYDEVFTLTNLLISAGPTVLTFVDEQDPNCSVELTVDPPLACSEPCETVINDLTISDCNNNGTLDNSDDDFFEVNLNVGLVDGIATGVVVTDNLGNSFGPFNYDSDINLGPYPADGQEITLTIIDQNNGSCLLQETISQSSCSDDCILVLDMLSAECSDNGTLDTNDDDVYTISFIVNGINNSPNGFLINNTIEGQYGETQVIENNLILDGDFELMITDLEDSSCTITTTVVAPAPCSSPCELSWTSFEVSDCDDNATGTDPEDDFYSVQFELTTISGTTSRYFITDNMGNEYGPFEYNMTVDLGPFDADGSELTLTVIDMMNASCNLTEVISQNSCSDLCIINASIVNVDCDDFGTTDTDLDDLFEVEILVEGINSSASVTIPTLNITEDANGTFIIQDLLIADGAFDIQIIDENNNDCFTPLTITPPATCSEPCEVNLVSLDQLTCDDNQTGNDDTDDFFAIAFNVSSDLGTGTEYYLRDNDGNIYGPYLYNQDQELDMLAANGSTIDFELFDEGNGSCSLGFTAMMNPCSQCNQSIIANSNIAILDCDNPAAILSFDSAENPVSVVWTGPNNESSTDTNFTVTTPGTYNLIATYADGCTAEDSVDLTASDDQPIAVLPPSGLLNCDQTSITLDLSASTITTNTTVEWLDDNSQLISDQDELTVTSEGSYFLRLTDSVTNCTSDLVEIAIAEDFTMPAAIIYANPDSILNCFIETISLSYEEEPNTIYTWAFQGEPLTESTTIVAQAGTVVLTAINTISNCESTDALTIEDLTQYPIIELSPIANLDCINGESCITASSPTTNELSYQWYDASNNLIQDGGMTICVDSPGSYTVVLTDINNDCANEETFTIEGPTMPMAELPVTITLMANENFDIIPVINVPVSDISSILWTTDAELSCYDCLTPTILDFENETEILLEIITTDGCEASALTTLLEDGINPPKVYIPNVFSPENNLDFTIYTNEEIDNILEMYIYDRWGNLVYYKENFSPNVPSEGWNGKYNGTPAIRGVYVYMFVYEEDGFIKYEAGDVTLL